MNALALSAAVLFLAASALAQPAPPDDDVPPKRSIDWKQLAKDLDPVIKEAAEKTGRELAPQMQQLTALPDVFARPTPEEVVRTAAHHNGLIRRLASGTVMPHASNGLQNAFLRQAADLAELAEELETAVGTLKAARSDFRRGATAAATEKLGQVKDFDRLLLNRIHRIGDSLENHGAEIAAIAKRHPYSKDRLVHLTLTIGRHNLQRSYNEYFKERKAASDYVLGTSFHKDADYNHDNRSAWTAFNQEMLILLDKAPASAKEDLDVLQMLIVFNHPNSL